MPLYRRIIRGHPLEQGAEYGATSVGGGGTVGDETEDLYALLNIVLVRPYITCFILTQSSLKEPSSRYTSSRSGRHTFQLPTRTRRTRVSPPSPHLTPHFL